MIEAQVPPRTFRLPTRGESITNAERVYYIGDRIGEGAFGVVYECTDDWGNELAAKILIPKGRSYQQVRDSWSRELSTLVQLRHPNITFVHDAFEYQDTFYIVVERCAWPISGLIGSENSSIWVPYLARDLLQALSFVHNNGYVHKDVHAGNVFVFHAKDFMVPEKAPVWFFKLGDFGISKLAEEIQPGTIMAAWMRPPEALEPSFGQIGPRTDVYHAALLLLSLALGKKLSFDEAAILNAEPRRLAESEAGTYSIALSRALRRHVSERTPTAAEFWRDILKCVPATSGA